ncbi:MAG: hypothetical protein QHH26_04075 [Armatimonadota bacterium]|nr:hypothetical protein [Armatimonadota bacterium]
MEALKERAKNAFEAYGESFAIGGRPTRGVFQQLDMQRMNMFFDDIEISTITRPALIAFIPADASASIDETITRDGRTYTIKKLAKLRAKDTVVMQVILLV